MKTNSHGGMTLWFTGLSGAGKSSIADRLSSFLEDSLSIKCFNLDGDKVRLGLNKDLKFSKQDRAENIRRISEVSKLSNSEGLFVVVSCISPYTQDRQNAKKIHLNEGLDFYQVFIAADLQVCQKRDVKGLYKLARDGKIPNFTGVSDPYEAPENPDLILQTGKQTQDQSFLKLLKFLQAKGHIKTSKSQIYDYLNFEAGVQELNILQTIQQGWSNIDNLMDYNQIIQSLYFTTVKYQEKEVFQPMPLYFICGRQMYQSSQRLKKKIRVRIFSKVDKRLIAVLEDAKFQKYRIQEICSKTFGIYSEKHPAIQNLIQKGQYILSGTKLIFKTRDLLFHDGLDYLRKSAQNIRNQFKQKKGDCLFAFQLRNPLHNGHLYLLQSAKKQLLSKGYKSPILLLHPCGGWVKDDDVPLDVRIKQHQKLLENSQFFKQNQYILGIWPSPMFYAGPREVLWHFSSRQKAQVDYMIVGRDPAGIKHPEKPTENLYDQYDGQRVLQKSYERGLIKAKILPFKMVSWNKVSQKLQQFDPKRGKQFENISGSQMRKMARQNTPIPDWFMNPNSWKVLSDYYRSLQK